MSRPIPMDLAAGQALQRGQTQRLPPVVEVPQVFTPEECARIVALRDRLGWDEAPIPVEEGTGDDVRGQLVDTEVRATERTHVLASRETRWIHDRLAATIERINGPTWGFKVAYMEPPQLLRYPVGGHFHWHSDLGDRGLSSLRKISATVLLSDPATYDQGELQFMSGARTITPSRAQGQGIFFPSYVNHRVTRVTRGHRDVLILWTVGKRSFR